MPTYEYECEACGHAYEKFQSITAPTTRKCPECGKLKLRRLIGTGAGILFKGSGFYQTDYRSDAYKKAAAADKPGGDDGANKTSKSDKDKGAAGAKKNDKNVSGGATKTAAKADAAG